MIVENYFLKSQENIDRNLSVNNTLVGKNFYLMRCKHATTVAMFVTNIISPMSHNGERANHIYLFTFCIMGESCTLPKIQSRIQSSMDCHLQYVTLSEVRFFSFINFSSFKNVVFRWQIKRTRHCKRREQNTFPSAKSPIKRNLMLHNNLLNISFQ